VHKLKICLKELNEARTWLKITAGSEMLPEASLTNITDECDELCRIINASIKTTLAKSNR
jgi:four helix bundle protein